MSFEKDFKIYKTRWQKNSFFTALNSRHPFNFILKPSEISSLEAPFFNFSFELCLVVNLNEIVLACKFCLFETQMDFKTNLLFLMSKSVFL